MSGNDERPKKIIDIDRVEVIVAPVDEEIPRTTPWTRQTDHYAWAYTTRDENREEERPARRMHGESLIAGFSYLLIGLSTGMIVPSLLQLGFVLIDVQNRITMGIVVIYLLAISAYFIRMSIKELSYGFGRPTRRRPFAGRYARRVGRQRRRR